MNPGPEPYLDDGGVWSRWVAAKVECKRNPGHTNGEIVVRSKVWPLRLSPNLCTHFPDQSAQMVRLSK